jgi:tRNA (adenine9-N1/guanine9-N1)-methyltransferase
MEELPCKRIILLDPNASDSLEKKDLIEAEAFVVGGIVDKEIPRNGITSLIPCEKPYCVRRKIVLKGSIYGVPPIIHKLIDTVLQAKYELNFDIDRAIINVMSKREKRWRIAKELIHMHRQGEDIYDSAVRLAQWLNLDLKNLLKAVRMSGLRIDLERLKRVYTEWNTNKLSS